MTIQPAESDDEIRACFPVMAQLRPHLVEAEFVARVRLMQTSGFRLAALSEAGVVRAVAGYRFVENLYAGRVLYVDDLVTDEGTRSRGHGKALLHWLIALASEERCASFELDSGVHRAEAHRFYFRERMHVSGFHFRLSLDPPAG